MDIEIVEEPSVVVVARRAELPMAEIRSFYDSAYGTVAAALGQSSAQISGPALGWYARMPGETVDVAAGFPVTGLEPGPVTEGVEAFTIAGGRAAVLDAVGPYDQLPQAWDTLFTWVQSNGEAPRGDFTEYYVTEPTPDGDPEQNVTRLVLPLA